MSIKGNLLKRLEKAEKRIIPNGIDVMVFIKETAEKGVFQVQQNVYYRNKYRARDSVKKWNVEASSIQEVADKYQPPEGCNEPILFLIDYREE